MIKTNSIVLLTILLLLTFQTRAQQHKVDSLRVLLKSDKPDTLKLRHLYYLSDECEGIGLMDEAVVYGKLLLPLGDELLKGEENAVTKSRILKFKAGIFGIFGLIDHRRGDYASALKNHFKSLELREKLGDVNGVAASKNNIGLVYTDQGNYPEALKEFFSALKIAEASGKKSTIAMLHTNVGLVYANQGNAKDALKYDFIALRMNKELGDIAGMMSVYNCIGMAYYNDGNFELALENFNQSLKLAQQVGDKQTEVTLLMNLGAVYYAFGLQEKDPSIRKKKYEEAYNCFLTGAKGLRESGAKPGEAGCLVDLGSVLIVMKRYSEAKMYLKQARDISIEIGYKDYTKNAFLGLMQADSALGDLRAAYEHYKMYVLYSDSLNNEETRKQTIQTQMTFDFEKKEAIAKAEYKKELENQKVLAEEKSRKQKLVLVMVSGFLVLVLFFAAFIFRSLKITRKQKKIIEEQKQLVEEQKKDVEKQKTIVEEHQKEIIDSIHYAKRIQQSLLPTETYMERNLNRLKS